MKNLQIIKQRIITALGWIKLNIYQVCKYSRTSMYVTMMYRNQRVYSHIIIMRQMGRKLQRNFEVIFRRTTNTALTKHKLESVNPFHILNILTSNGISFPTYNISTVEAILIFTENTHSCSWYVIKGIKKSNSYP